MHFWQVICHHRSLWLSFSGFKVLERQPGSKRAGRDGKGKTNTELAFLKKPGQSSLFLKHADNIYSLIGGIRKIRRRCAWSCEADEIPSYDQSMEHHAESGDDFMIIISIWWNWEWAIKFRFLLDSRKVWWTERFHHYCYPFHWKRLNMHQLQGKFVY